MTTLLRTAVLPLLTAATLIGPQTASALEIARVWERKHDGSWKELSNAELKKVQEEGTYQSGQFGKNATILIEFAGEGAACLHESEAIRRISGTACRASWPESGRALEMFAPDLAVADDPPKRIVVTNTTSSTISYRLRSMRGAAHDKYVDVKHKPGETIELRAPGVSSADFGVIVRFPNPRLEEIKHASKLEWRFGPFELRRKPGGDEDTGLFEFYDSEGEEVPGGFVGGPTR